MGSRRRLHYLILLLPLILLWVPFYNRVEPAIFGIPFFYWYQMAWIPLAVVLTAIVWLIDRRVGP